MWSHGSFHWNELMTHDVARAEAFYAGTIGWTFEPMPMPGGGTYWIAKAGDKPAGGLFAMDCPDLKDLPEQWVPYLAVDDIDARLARAHRCRCKRDAGALRGSRRRPNRDPARARRRHGRLDDARVIAGAGSE